MATAKKNVYTTVSKYKSEIGGSVSIEWKLETTVWENDPQSIVKFAALEHVYVEGLGGIAVANDRIGISESSFDDETHGEPLTPNDTTALRLLEKLFAELQDDMKIALQRIGV